MCHVGDDCPSQKKSRNICPKSSGFSVTFSGHTLWRLTVGHIPNNLGELIMDFAPKIPWTVPPILVKRRTCLPGETGAWMISKPNAWMWSKLASDIPGNTGWLTVIIRNVYNGLLIPKKLGSIFLQKRQVYHQGELVSHCSNVATYDVNLVIFSMFFLRSRLDLS